MNSLAMRLPPTAKRTHKSPNPAMMEKHNQQQVMLNLSPQWHAMGKTRGSYEQATSQVQQPVNSHFVKTHSYEG